MKLARRLFLSPSLTEMSRASRMLLRTGYIPHNAAYFLSLSSDGRFLSVYERTVHSEKWYRKGDETIVGLAASRGEADELIAEIAALSLSESGDPAPGAYLKRYLEEDHA